MYYKVLTSCVGLTVNDKIICFLDLLLRLHSKFVDVCGGFWGFFECLIFNNFLYFVFKGWALSAWSLFSSLQQASISEYVGISDSRTSKSATSGACSVTDYNFKSVLSSNHTINAEKVFVFFCVCVVFDLIWFGFFSCPISIFFLLFNLQELCLHTKLLAPINCPIVDFLMKAPDPPPALIVRNAVQILKVS